MTDDFQAAFDAEAREAFNRAIREAEEAWVAEHITGAGTGEIRGILNIAPPGGFKIVDKDEA